MEARVDNPSHALPCYDQSPHAGTGKTLSLICSVLQWLEDTQSQENQAADADSDGDQTRLSKIGLQCSNCNTR